MNPIFNEYIGFLNNTSKTKIKDLTEGYFWLVCCSNNEGYLKNNN